MNRVDRAKQFLPFDALKGLKEELEKREKETLKCEKKELSEYETEQINEKLKKANGVNLQVEYYKNGEYVKLKGIAKVNCSLKCLIVNDEKIFFDDIRDLIL